MFDTRTNLTRDFSEYDRMDTEALEQLLRQSLLLPSDETDADALLYISELLVARDGQTEESKQAAVQTAFQSFNRNYRPRAVGSGDHPVPEKNNGLTSSDHPAAPRRRFSALRVLAAAAILVLVFALGSATSLATGFDFFGAVATWTDSIFILSPDGDYDPIHYPDTLRPLVYKLQEYDVSLDMLPRSIPDGYEFVRMEVGDLSSFTDIVTMLSDGENNLMLQYHIVYTQDHVVYHEKNSGDPETLVLNGIEFYLFYNSERLNAVWAQDNVEATITMTGSREDMIEILKTIGGSQS